MSVAIDLRPPAKKHSALAANDVEFVDGTIGDQRELDAMLEREAKRIGLTPAALFEGLVEEFGVGASFEEMLEALEESAHYDPVKHPRWPKGTPGGLGGRFMTVGQRFKLKGVEYDVAAVFPGHIYANVATKGIKGTPKTIEIKADGSEVGEDGLPHPVITGVERPPAETIHGAKAQTTSASFTGTVVDPYVDPSTHDPSIPIPEGSGVTPEQWKRFGKLDQERYAQVQELYGPWSASQTQTKVNGILSHANTHAKNLLVSGHSDQIGTSTGFTLSFHSIFSGMKNFVTGTPQVEAKRTEFEQVRALQDEVAGVLQWDLYNRTKAPDVAVFHRTYELGLFQNEIINGHKPVFAGLSQSQKWTKSLNTGFGDSTFATPMAIRHIVMFRDAANISHNGLQSELEIANEDAYAADNRSMAWSPGGITSMQTAWLTKKTVNGAPGSTIAELKESMADGGANLPVPPADPVLTMDSQTAATYVTPPKEATTGIGKLAYAELDTDGKPVAHSAKDLDLHPGDYIEGMKGTRYIIVADTSYSLGIAYFKVTDLGTKVPGSETTFGGTATWAFSGHNDHGGSPEAYHFEQDGKLPFKKLAGHYNLPVYSSEWKGDFNPEAWATSANDQAKMLSKFDDGQFFKLNGTYYKVIGQLGVGQVKVQSQTTGEYGKINSDYKSPYLVLKDGYAPSGQLKLSSDDFFKGQPTTVGEAFDSMTPGTVWQSGQTLWTVEAQQPDGHVQMVQGSGADKNVGKQHVFDATQSFSPMTPKPPDWMPPEVGDTLAVDGKKATVTKLLKDGTVQINLAPGVMKLKLSDPLLAGIFSPAKWTVGDKTKLKDIGAGTLIHGGTGVKVRPYRVMAHFGNDVTIKSLDTGEEMHVSGGKSYAQLLPVSTQAVLAPGSGTFVPTPESLTSSWDPEAWEMGPTKSIVNLVPGDIIALNGVPLKVLGYGPGVDHPTWTKGDSSKFKLENLITGQVADAPVWSAVTGNVGTYQLKGTPAVGGAGAKATPGMTESDLSGYETLGAPQTVGKLNPEPGTLLQSSKTGQAWVVDELSAPHVIAHKVGDPGGQASLSTTIPFFLLKTKDAEHPHAVFQGEQIDPDDYEPSDWWPASTADELAASGDWESGQIVLAAGGNWYQILAPSQTGAGASSLQVQQLPVKGSILAQPGQMQMPFTLMPDTLLTPVQLKAGVASVPSGYEAQGQVPVSDLTTGDVFLKPPGSAFGSSSVLKVTGESDTGVWVLDVNKAAGSIHMKSEDWGGTLVTLLKPVQVTASPVSAKGTTYVGGFNPMAYTSFSQEPTGIQLGDLATGAIYTDENGAYKQVTGHSPGSLLTYVTNLTTGLSAAEPASAKAMVLYQTKDSPAYDALLPGSPTALGDLEPGDQFLGVDGQLGQVVAKADMNDEQPQVTTAPVLPNGSLGNPFATGNAPLNHVLFKAYAADVPAPMPAAALPDELDVGGLPKLEIEGYKWHKSATLVYPKLVQVPEGEYVKTKSGLYLKVIKGGSNTLVVTDGEKLYKTDGETRVRHVDEKTPMDATIKKYLDAMPGMATATPEQNEALLVKAKLVPTEGKSMAQLGLKKGDWFEGDGDDAPHKITVVTPIEGDYAVHDSTSYYSAQFEPTGYWKADGTAAAEPSSASLIVSTLATKASGNPDDYDKGPMLGLIDMDPGDTFTLGASPVVHMVVGKKGKETTVQNVTTGEAPFTVSPSAGTTPLQTLIPKAGSPAIADPDVAPIELPEFVKNSTAKPISDFPIGSFFSSKLDERYVWKIEDKGGDYTTVTLAKSPDKSSVIGSSSQVMSSYVPGSVALPAGDAGPSYDLDTFTPNDLSVTVVQLPSGSLFSDKESGGYVYKKTGETLEGTAFEILAPPIAAGNKGVLPFDHVPGLVQQPVSVPAAPSGGPSTNPDDYVEGKATTLGALPDGAFFKSLAGTLYEKTTVDGAPGANKLGGGAINFLLPTMPVTPMTPKEATGGMVPNVGKKSFLELGLGVGDKVDLYDGISTVTKVYGEPGTDGHVYDTVNDATGKTGTFGTGGVPGGYLKVASASKIDVSGFTKNAKDASAAKQLSDFPPGTLIALDDGASVWKVTGAAGPDKAVTMEVVQPSSPSAMAGVGTEGDLPASFLPSSYQLPPGWLKAGQLKVGDSFVPPNTDQVWMVTKRDDVVLAEIQNPPEGYDLPVTLPFGVDLIVKQYGAADPDVEPPDVTPDATNKVTGAPIDFASLAGFTHNPEGSVGELGPGAYFTAPSAVPNGTHTVWQVTGVADEHGNVPAKVVSSPSSPKAVGKDTSVKTTQAIGYSAASTLPAPSEVVPGPDVEPAKYTGPNWDILGSPHWAKLGSSKLESLEIGDMFSMEDPGGQYGTAQTPDVWQVTGPPVDPSTLVTPLEGTVPAKIVSTSTASAMGFETKLKAELEIPFLLPVGMQPAGPERAFDAAKVDWKASAGETMDDLPVGTIFAVSTKHPTLPSDYQGEKNTIWQLAAKSPPVGGWNTDANDYDSVVVQSAQPENVGKHVPVTKGFVPKWHNAGPSAPTAEPAEQFDPSTVGWESVGKKIGDLPVGAYFSNNYPLDNPDAIIWQVAAKEPNPALYGGQSHNPDDFDSVIVQTGGKALGEHVPVMKSFAPKWTAIPPEQATASPVTAPGAISSETPIQAGTLVQFVQQGAAIWKVTGVDGNDVAAEIVKPSLSANAQTVGYKTTFYRPDMNTGWFVVGQDALDAVTDPLQGYKWHKSATKKYPRLSQVAVGAEFEDVKHNHYVMMGKAHKGYVTIASWDGTSEYVVSDKTRVFVIGSDE